MAPITLYSPIVAPGTPRANNQPSEAQSSTEPSTKKSKKKNKKKETKSVQTKLRAHEMERRLETAAERDSSVAAFLQEFAKASAASGDEAAYANSFLSAIKALKPEISQARKWAQKKIEKDLKITDKELAMFQEKGKGKDDLDSTTVAPAPRSNGVVGAAPWWEAYSSVKPPVAVVPHIEFRSTGDGGTQKYRQKAGVSYDPNMYQDLASFSPTAPSSDRRLASVARYREALPRIARLKARMALNDPSLRAFGNATQPNVGRSGVPLAYDPNSPFRVRKNY